MQADGYPIGKRRESAMRLARRNQRNAHAAWLAQIPREPRELVKALQQAGVDLDELRRALPH